MLLSAEHITKTYGTRSVLDDVSLYLEPGQKLGIIGVNGTGKSTLLRILAGAEEPDSGSVSRDPNVRLDYLPQLPDFDPANTVLEQVFAGLSDEARAVAEYEAKAILTRLGVPQFDQPVGQLSGGQRKRVALCAALVSGCDVLILDEPTNHLDSDMVAWLEDYLRTFKGALVMVTHDRYFLERVTDRLVEVEGGRLFFYEGNYTDYLAAQKEQERTREKARKTAPEKKEERPSGPKKLRFSYKEQREYETIDGDIAALEEELAAIKAQQEARASDYVALQELQAQQEALEAALEEKMDRWVYLNDLAERIAGQ